MLVNKVPQGLPDPLVQLVSQGLLDSRELL